MQGRNYLTHESITTNSASFDLARFVEFTYIGYINMQHLYIFMRLYDTFYSPKMCSTAISQCNVLLRLKVTSQSSSNAWFVYYGQRNYGQRINGQRKYGQRDGQLNPQAQRTTCIGQMPVVRVLMPHAYIYPGM